MRKILEIIGVFVLMLVLSYIPALASGGEWLTHLSNAQFGTVNSACLLEAAGYNPSITDLDAEINHAKLLLNNTVLPELNSAKSAAGDNATRAKISFFQKITYQDLSYINALLVFPNSRKRERAKMVSKYGFILDDLVKQLVPVNLRSNACG